MNDLYVAGIGASAGGLAALKLMLEHLPAKTGVAFVLIQHLPADHRSALVELLRPAAKTLSPKRPTEPCWRPTTFTSAPPRRISLWKTA